jgi:hypothetical protein
MISMRALLPAILLATAFSTAPAQADKKPAADVTGKWSFAVASDVGTGTPTVTFKQKGDSLTGHYSSVALGEIDFVGTYKDGKINFGFSAEAGGQAFSMSFAGTVEGNDDMKGAIDFAGMATGTFTGKRQKP